MIVVRDYRLKKENSLIGQDIVFLVWNSHGIRAETISRYLGACLYFLYTTPARHASLFVKTLNILRKDKPKLIICQSPPMTCSLVALVYRYVFAKGVRCEIFIDAHGHAFYKPWSRLKFLSKFIMKKARLVIVSNAEEQNSIIHDYDIKPVVLEDPIPLFDSTIYPEKANRKKWQNSDSENDNDKIFKVAVINPFRYAPLREILNAASELTGVTKFYITGDYSKTNKSLLATKTDNAIVTGFLPLQEYAALLRHVDAIIDLTTDQATMLAGAYEAVALEKPLITTYNSPLRRYFNRGTLHVNNSTSEIKEAITLARERKTQLQREMHELKLERQNEWEQKFSSLVREYMESSPKADRFPTTNR
jgi:hypothetical protein